MAGPSGRSYLAGAMLPAASPIGRAALALVLVAPLPGLAQEAAAPDSVAADSVAADSIAHWAGWPRPTIDPRITLLGDTLALADTTAPKFSKLVELWPDSLVDPYVPDRPGAAPAWVLTGDQLLGRGAFSLLDVIESEEPVVAQDLGGGGVEAYLGSPLGTYDNVEVFVDGVPVTGPSSAGWDLRRIPLESIAKVAWYPGPRTAGWGGSGAGGVLAITTRRTLSPAARSMLAFTVGSFDVETFSGSFGRSVTRDGELFLAGNFDATDGFTGGDYTRNQVAFKFGWRLGERHRIEFGRVSDGFSGDGVRVNLAGSQDVDGVILRGSYLGRLGPAEVRLHGYRSTEDRKENFDYRELPGIVGEGRRTGFRGEVDLRRGPWRIWGSAARESARVESLHPAFTRGDGSSVFEPTEDGEAFVVESPRRSSEWGGGAGFATGGGTFEIGASLRRHGFGETAESGTGWRVDAIGRPRAGVGLRLGAGRSIRPPGFLDQALLGSLADAGVEIHPGLVADPTALETWTGVDAAVDWDLGGWSVAGRVARSTGDGAFLWLAPTAWLSFDASQIETFRIGGAGFNTFDVIDLAASVVEAETRFPLPWGLSGRAVVRRLGLEAADSGEDVPYAPRSQAFGQARWAGRFFPSRDLLVELRLTGRWVGERSTLGDEDLPSYGAVDGLLQATIINFTVFVSFKNIGGRRYRTDEAFFVPGREGFFGINWRFRD